MQIKKIFIKQNIWIGIFAIIIALPLGNFMTDYIFKNAIGDSYDFEAMIKPATFIFSAFSKNSKKRHIVSSYPLMVNPLSDFLESAMKAVYSFASI